MIRIEPSATTLLDVIAGWFVTEAELEQRLLHAFFSTIRARGGNVERLQLLYGCRMAAAATLSSSSDVPPPPASIIPQPILEELLVAALEAARSTLDEPDGMGIIRQLFRRLARTYSFTSLIEQQTRPQGEGDPEQVRTALVTLAALELYAIREARQRLREAVENPSAEFFVRGSSPSLPDAISRGYDALRVANRHIAAAREAALRELDMRLFTMYTDLQPVAFPTEDELVAARFPSMAERALRNIQQKHQGGE